MFQGKFEHTLDDKGRLAVPSPFRRKLGGEEVDGVPLLPELYVVPEAAIEAERQLPGSQPRRPNENVPLLWTQSLTWLGDLLLHGLITPDDLDPSGRRLGSSLGADQVLRVRRLNLADGEPFAVVTVWCPAELGQDLSRSDVERSPFYELLHVRLSGATQTIGADAVGADDAALLGVPAGSPVLRCERTTTDESGRPVLFSEHVFPAHRTEFVVDLPHAEPSIAPTGLRLVE